MWGSILPLGWGENAEQPTDLRSMSIEMGHKIGHSEHPLVSSLKAIAKRC